MCDFLICTNGIVIKILSWKRHCKNQPITDSACVVDVSRVRRKCIAAVVAVTVEKRDKGGFRRWQIRFQNGKRETG